MTAAFAVWTLNNAYRATSKGSTQAKIDTAVTVVLGGFTGYNLI
jgi:hypothetical protein